MTEAIAQFLEKITGDDLLTLLLLSFVPLVELRGALILSGGMEMHPAVAYAMCVLGASIVVFPLLYLAKPILARLKEWRLTKKLAEATQTMIEDKAKSVEARAERPVVIKRAKRENKQCVALYIFVAIPLPFTGAWTGSAIGALLGLPVWKAGLSVIAGNLTAGAIMLLLVLFAGEYVDIILIAFVVILAFLFLVLTWGKMMKFRAKSASVESGEQGSATESPADNNEQTATFDDGAENEKLVAAELPPKEESTGDGAALNDSAESDSACTKASHYDSY